MRIDLDSEFQVKILSKSKCLKKFKKIFRNNDSIKNGFDVLEKLQTKSFNYWHAIFYNKNLNKASIKN